MGQYLVPYLINMLFHISNMQYYMSNILSYIVSTQYYNLNTKYQLFRKISLRNWAGIFEGKEPFFQTGHFPGFFAKPLYQNVCIDNRIIFIFDNNENPW